MEFGLGYIGVGLGLGLAVLGAGLGIGRIGGSAAEGISRQPDAGGKIQTAMIISAGLIEGAALFAIVIALLASLTLGGELTKTVNKAVATPAAASQTEGK
ncbi:ATP synthase F0 subunit C [Leptospira koniambonensis]|uniref:ATP synthase subunit c n=1 Tax=Leptospira koniambonensis TaxID=2484950 RepID=A0A4R9J416_9LEPT|nr:ATP synthase F0 subunit C [Leptospira koniambonensis]TGL28410.1 ATP synthase F0 subunit C [Leptospira koniambonensis]